MNTKTIIISVGLVFVIGLIMLASVINKSSPATAPVSNATLPSASFVNPGTGAGPTVVPGGVSVGGVETLDFLKNPTTFMDSSNPGFYYLGYDPNKTEVSTASDTPYVIFYISDTQFFNIALTQEPVGASREAAQQYLMKQLGITEAQMCSLDYMVSTPYRVNQFYTGKSLGFSFCPGAVQLPK